MIFFVALTMAMVLSYSYIGWRLITPTSMPEGKKRVTWTILLTMPLLVPLSFLLQVTTEESAWSDVLGWIAYISMGFFSLLFALLLTRDLFWVLSRIAACFGTAERLVVHRL